MKDSKWLAKTRKRLKNLGWFMKCLKPSARLANEIDGCEGNFFASRYKSIAILSLEALFIICIYIDLNSLAAGVATVPEDSPYTSIRKRVQFNLPHMADQDFDLHSRESYQVIWQAAKRSNTIGCVPLKIAMRKVNHAEEYCKVSHLHNLLLIDHSARLFRPGKAYLNAEVDHIFTRPSVQMLRSGSKGYQGSPHQSCGDEPTRRAECLGGSW